MAISLSELETRRRDLLSSISGIGDMRPGSVVTAFRRCGKPNCHCAMDNDPGHGPSKRITYKRNGKTVTEALPDTVAIREVERQIIEFRRFQQLTEELVEVSVQICRLRSKGG